MGTRHSEERVEAMVALREIKLVKPWMTVGHPALPKRMQNEKLTGGLVRARNLKNNGVEGMVWGLGSPALEGLVIS